MPEVRQAKPIDVIVPVHGKLKLTIDCIESLYRNTQSPFHLIILDDTDASLKHGSFHPIEPTDITSEYLSRLANSKSNITYINRDTTHKEGNEFFNLGFKYCKYDYIATVMNSMIVEPNWEVAATRLMDEQPDVGIIGFKCLFPNGLIESAGIFFNGCQPCDYGRDQPGYRFSEVYEMPAVQWAFALLRKKAVIGNLEENVFYGHVGWDDIDNCFAVKAKGWRVLYCGLGVGIHHPRATRGSDSLDAYLRNKENAYAFMKRWGYWNMFQEGSKLDIQFKLKPETKEKLTKIIWEYHVLQDLLNQAYAKLQTGANAAMQEIGVDPEKFVIEMNPQSNIWALKNRPEKPVPDDGNANKTTTALATTIPEVVKT